MKLLDRIMGRRETALVPSPPRAVPAWAETVVRSPDIGQVLISESEVRQGLDAPTDFSDYLSLYGEDGPRWVRACVDAIAQDVSAMRVLPIDWRTGEEVDRWPHPALERPNPFQTLNDVLEEAVIDLILTGNAALLVDSSNELWKLPIDKLRIFPDRLGHVAGYGLADANGRVKQRFDREQIVHIKLPNPTNRHWGVGPLQALKRTILMSDGEDRYAINFYENGAQFAGYLKAPVEMDEKQARKGGAQFKAGHTGRKRGGVPILQAMDWVRTAANPEEAAWEAIRNLTREEFLAVFGVPMVRLGLPGANYATDREQRIGYYQGKVFPIARRMMRAISRNRLLVPTPNQVRVEADESKVLAEYRDEGAIATAASTVVQAGILTPNEARARFYDLGDLPVEEKEREVYAYHLQYGILTKNEVRKKLGFPAKSGKGWNEPPDLLASLGGGAPRDEAPWARDVEPGERAAPIIIPRDGHLRTLYERDWCTRQDKRAERLRDVVRKTTARIASEVRALVTKPKRADDGGDDDLDEIIKRLLDYDPRVRDEVLGDWLPEIVRALAEEGALKIRLTGLPEDAFSLQDPRVRQWIAEEGAALVRHVEEGTITAIRDAIDKSVSDNESLEQLTERLMSAPEIGGDRVRAERIARTETTTAAGYASKAAYQQAEEAGVRIRRRWLTIGDSNVRPSHRHADGRTAGVDEAFTLGTGQTAEYPGDPKLPAGERINCRCDVVPEVIEVDE